MGWSEQLFNYCERGLDGSFWAEPLNAATNGAFIFAALAGAVSLARLEHQETAKHRTETASLWLLVALVAAIGIGSFLFHTFATRWALIADVAPITIFMVAFLIFSLRKFLGIGWPATAVLVIVFFAAGTMTERLICRVLAALAADGSHSGQGVTCLNGSLGYLPALVSLVLVGLPTLRHYPATGRKLLIASVVFAVSVVFRTVDQEICAATVLLGHPRGTHPLWHVLNGVTLYLLLQAAIQWYDATLAGKAVTVAGRQATPMRNKS
jgi:hypothetical protein